VEFKIASLVRQVSLLSSQALQSVLFWKQKGGGITSAAGASIERRMRELYRYTATFFGWQI